jgi:hypothetical protein
VNHMLSKVAQPYYHDQAMRLSFSGGKDATSSLSNHVRPAGQKKATRIVIETCLKFEL